MFTYKAAIIGSKFNWTKIVNGKTLEGSLAFAFSTFLFCIVVQWSFENIIEIIFVSVLGALAELLFSGIDNFSIPVIMSLAVSFVKT